MNKATLIKKSDNIYYLYIDESWSTASTDERDNRDKKLSLKNCHSIDYNFEFDLELYSAHYGASKVRGGKSVDFGLGASQGFEEGFQKALELLGNKKFTEEDIKKAIDFDKWHIEYGNVVAGKTDKEINEFIQTLQPNMWEVEIEQILIKSSIEDGDAVWEDKLDSDGCLILKKIN